MTKNQFTGIDKQLIVSGSPPFPCCHASTLVRLPDGALFAAWFAGSVEGADDVNIWGAKCIDGSWQPPRIIMQSEEVHWNPVLMTETDGSLLLFYKVGKLIASWCTLWARSVDGGESWSVPVELVEGDHGGRGPVRNKIIVLKDGSWLAPASLEDGGNWRSFTDRSTDGGHSWVKSLDVAMPGTETGYNKVETAIAVSEQSFKGRGLIQPTLWESATGVHMLMRTTEGFIYRSDSKDGGLTWCAAYPTALPNNNSGLDLVAVNDHEIYLVCNPVEGNWAARTPLALLYSCDDGATWEHCLTLEDNLGEYSYPAIIHEGNKLMITYTWDRKNIAFRTLCLH